MEIVVPILIVNQGLHKELILNLRQYTVLSKIFLTWVKLCKYIYITNFYSSSLLCKYTEYKNTAKPREVAKYQLFKSYN